MVVAFGAGGPDLNVITKGGCPIFAAFFAAKVGIRATPEPFLFHSTTNQQLTALSRDYCRAMAMRIAFSREMR